MKLICAEHRYPYYSA